MRFVLSLLAALFCFASIADACAVCAVGDEDSKVAFIVTTIILSFVPLLMIGGGSYMVYRRYNAPEFEHSESSEDASSKLSKQTDLGFVTVEEPS